MVFPSIRCLTCKNRRVKCDATRPRCDRCCKGNRDCFWEDSNASATDIPFKNENAFAQGRPRRPRKRIGIVTKPQSGNFSVYKESTPLNLQRVDFPIEIYAFQYWIENLASWPEDLFDVGQEYGAGARYHSRCVDETKSSLHLAVSAFSLAIFGRANNAYEILQRAEKNYARSITELRKELKVLSNGIIDELLIATMILSKYDNIMYGFRVRKSLKPLPSAQDSGLPLLGSYAYHYKGTASLLQVRQERGYTQNVPLEKAVRRTIIRAHLLSGDPVPEWLQDDTYGEPDPALALDYLMIKAASLRSRSIIIINQVNRGMPPFNRHGEALKTVLAEAQMLDRLFAEWAENIPQSWKFITHEIPQHDDKKLPLEHHNLFFDRMFHSYATHGHAVVWHRYRAVRLLINSIEMDLLSQVAQYRPENPGKYLELSKICQETINNLITDLCRGIPFFYLLNPCLNHSQRHTKRAVELDDSMTTISSQFPPLMMAVLLAWPITIAVGIEGVPPDQMEWLKSRLQAVTQMVGSPMLQVTGK